MLTSSQRSAVTGLIKESLDRSERTWGEHADMLDHAMESLAMDAQPEFAKSAIPGYEFVSLDKPSAENFIALVLDMRGSSNHLAQAISAKLADVSQFQRVYYETSALLPAMAMTVGFKGGKITEYLGDGALALFRVADFAEPKDAIYAAHNAAKHCLNETLSLVNAELAIRYRLPPLVIGIGMALSPALVVLVGLRNEMQARVLGECVYRASKLSGGDNTIIIDHKMKQVWPKRSGGGLRFRLRTMKGIEGYEIVLNEHSSF